MYMELSLSNYEQLKEKLQTMRFAGQLTVIDCTPEGSGTRYVHIEFPPLSDEQIAMIRAAYKELFEYQEPFVMTAWQQHHDPKYQTEEDKEQEEREEQGFF